MSTFLDNTHYFYAQTDGSYAWPNSAEGDLLKQGHKEINELRAKLAAAEKDAERYRTLRDGGYLSHMVQLHVCDEPRRAEFIDAQVDRYAAIAKEKE